MQELMEECEKIAKNEEEKKKFQEARLSYNQQNWFQNSCNYYYDEDARMYNQPQALYYPAPVNSAQVVLSVGNNNNYPALNNPVAPVNEQPPQQLNQNIAENQIPPPQANNEPPQYAGDNINLYPRMSSYQDQPVLPPSTTNQYQDNYNAQRPPEMELNQNLGNNNMYQPYPPYQNDPNYQPQLAPPGVPNQYYQQPPMYPVYRPNEPIQYAAYQNQQPPPYQ